MNDSLFPLPHGDVPGVTWPPVHSTQTATLAALAEQLNRLQWSDPETIAAGQRRQLLTLARYFDNELQWFADRLVAVGLTPETLAEPGGLERLQLLTRRDLQLQFAKPLDLTLPPGHAPVSDHSSSGTTGEPVHMQRTSINNLDWMAMTLRYYDWMGLPLSGRIAAIRALSKPPENRESWGAPLALFHKTGPALFIDLRNTVSEQIDKLIAFKPIALLSYPSNVKALIRELKDRDEPLTSIKYVVTVGESVPDDVRELVSEHWGAKLGDCYSSEETGYVALNCPVSDLYHTMDELLIVEILAEDGTPCAAGETGRVVVTDLRNMATPIIRYEIGDWAERGPPCNCGRGLKTISRIQGRYRNMIHLPNGQLRWASTGFRRFHEVAPIRRYQLIQHAVDRFELKLVVDRPLTPGEEARLHDIEYESLGYEFELELTYHDALAPSGARGKFEEFVSMIGEN